MQEEKRLRIAKASREYYAKNKEACRKRHLLWYEANREYIREQQRIKKRQKKLWAIAYLGDYCQVCGGKFHPAVYEFHHLDPTTKDKDPSKLMHLSQKKLELELDKCELLCANCHRLRHHGDNY